MSTFSLYAFLQQFAQDSKATLQKLKRKSISLNHQLLPVQPHLKLPKNSSKLRGRVKKKQPIIPK